MDDELELTICVACGTQFDVPLSSHPPNCRICDDPRQYVLPDGQQWTSLAKEQGKHENTIEQSPRDERIWFISTGPKVWLNKLPGIWQSGPAEKQPKLGIGERCILIQTPEGNVLWDLIAWIDDKTIDFINSKGGLKAIVISHPHFYTTHLVWARTFNCPVYVNALDKEWLNRADSHNRRRYIEGPTETIIPGVTAIRTGGHFDGSMVLHFDKTLFIADSIMTTPSGIYHIDRPSGTTSYAFMWSYPNMIPLPPPKIHGIWKAIKSFEFEHTFGGFTGQDVSDTNLKQRVLDSMKIQVRNAGHDVHDILTEKIG